MNGYININQKGLVDFCTKNNCKIDLVDATLLSYITNFILSDKIVKKLIDNRVYGWISTKKIIHDNPLINISNIEVIGRRIKKLVDIGLLYTYLCKEEGNKKYYAISDSLHKIITNSYDTTDSSVDTPTDSSVDTPTDSSVDTPTDSSVDTLPTFESGNSKINNNLNNSKINNRNKKINKKSFSFSLSKKTQFENLSKEYKTKLKAKLLLEFGTKALDKLNDFELSCISNGYQYKNFYAAFKKWYKDLSPRDEVNIDANIKNMPKDFVYIGIQNNIAYAVNPKTLEIIEGKAMQKQTETYQKEQNNSYSIYEVGQSEKIPLNTNMSELLEKVGQRF